uniref:Uncharacterized protein n=1 Tax=Panagrolaimus davidi TaxID=227884 RepID=A0A914QN35_9BILA
MGIQLNHVAMGFFQERIITQGYPKSDDTFIIDKFGDAQFLVLINRIVALLLCGIYLFYDYRRLVVFG